jgi:hypothetical protein
VRATPDITLGERVCQGQRLLHTLEGVVQITERGESPREKAETVDTSILGRTWRVACLRLIQHQRLFQVGAGGRQFPLQAQGCPKRPVRF